MQFPEFFVKMPVPPGLNHLPLQSKQTAARMSAPAGGEFLALPAMNGQLVYSNERF
jgi:hypothetical protein